MASANVVYLPGMEILNVKYLISKPSVETCPEVDRPEFAFIGRSNVGKSSLINMLCNYAGLAKTSAQPGKTQMINFFSAMSTPKAGNKKRDEWYLVDLPGYGYAKVSKSSRKSWTRMIEDYLRKRQNLVNTFVLIDSRHSPQTIDLEFINQLGEWQIPFALVFTKTDKVKPMALKRNVEEFSTEMLKSWESMPPFFLSSATDKTGRTEILDYMGDILREVTKPESDQ